MNTTNEKYEANKATDFDVPQSVEDEVQGHIQRIGELADKYGLSAANIVCVGAHTEFVDGDKHARGFKVLAGGRLAKGSPPEIEACLMISQLGLLDALPLVNMLAIKLKLEGGSERVGEVGEYDAMRATGGKSANTLPA